MVPVDVATREAVALRGRQVVGLPARISSSHDRFLRASPFTHALGLRLSSRDFGGFFGVEDPGGLGRRGQLRADLRLRQLREHRAAHLLEPAEL